MAPANTPWDGLYWVFPGSIYQGPAPTYVLLLGAYVGYGLLALAAFFFFLRACVTKKTSSIMAMFNFLGVLAALVTAPGPLLGFIPSPVIYYGERAEENGPTLYEYPHPAATYFAAMLVFGFPLHSITNTCRLIYDAQGPTAAGFMVPFAVAMQIWAILPIISGGHLPIYWFIVLVIHFGQLLSGAAHWLLRAFDSGRCGRQGDRVKARRLWYGFTAALLQLISFMPSYCYIISYNEDRDALSTAGLVLCYVNQVLCEGVAQILWLRVGRLTSSDHISKSRRVFAPEVALNADLAEAQYEARLGVKQAGGPRILRDPYVPANTRLASPEMGYSASV
jgi:hypothetical protein